MRRLSKEIIINNIKKYIGSNKFLNYSKYFKNNYWSWAAWDSWAATGKAGGCRICNNNFYNASLRNKRATTKKGSKSNKYNIEVSANFCSECVKLIETEINFEFKKI